MMAELKDKNHHLWLSFSPHSLSNRITCGFNAVHITFNSVCHSPEWLTFMYVAMLSPSKRKGKCSCTLWIPGRLLQRSITDQASAFVFTLFFMTADKRWMAPWNGRSSPHPPLIMTYEYTNEWINVWARLSLNYWPSHAHTLNQPPTRTSPPFPSPDDATPHLFKQDLSSRNGSILVGDSLLNNSNSLFFNIFRMRFCVWLGHVFGVFSSGLFTKMKIIHFNPMYAEFESRSFSFVTR